MSLSWFESNPIHCSILVFRKDSTVLVLSRKLGERIVIGEGETRVVIEFVGFDGRGRAKIGIEAAENVKILREEIIKREEGK